MAQNSKIEWTTHTFNPWRGCTKVSAGCANCYAETLSKRNPKVLGIWGDNGTRVVASESMWREPLKWNEAARIAGERHRVFCASLADVCEERRDVDGARIRLKAMIWSTPHLDWLLLTKRPQNYTRLFWGPNPGEWPDNVWAGTSCENQQTADERIPHLLRVPAAVRFLSLEPLLGSITLSTWLPNQDADQDTTAFQTFHRPEDGLHWVIVGGESGANARPMNIEWARSIVSQCKSAGVPVFVKQLGAFPICRHSHPPTANPASCCECFPLSVRDRKGGDMSEWPEDLRIRQMPHTSPVAADSPATSS